MTPCTFPGLTVHPTPEEAPSHGFSPCRALVRKREPPVCGFGVHPKRAKEQIALVGDSHALHWRGALEVVAQKERWRGYSLTSVGCPLSAAAKYLIVQLGYCAAWYRSVLRWFREHPKVTTVFVSQYTEAPYSAPPGRTSPSFKVAGFRRAWRLLPKTVKRVIAIRDSPITTRKALDCVKTTVATGKERAGPACPVPRSFAVRFDAAVAAAQSLRSKRYRYVDLTDFFCGPAECYPVVGGVLMYRDIDHITTAYATTLGPYLLREVRAVL